MPRQPDFRRFAAAVLFALLLASLQGKAGTVLSLPAHAPVFDATHLLRPTPVGPIWLLHVGDDTGNDPAYAQPGYDDSTWLHADLTHSVKEYIPSSRPKVVWYRERLRVSPEQAGLALQINGLEKAYDLYIDGQRVAGIGRVAPYRPDDPSVTQTVPIPHSALASGTLLVALRVHIGPEDWQSSYPGLYPSNVLIGDLQALQDGFWVRLVGKSLLDWFTALLGFCVSLAAAALYGARRRHVEYLWLLCSGLTDETRNIVRSLAQLYPVDLRVTALMNALVCLNSLFVILMYFAMIQVRIQPWLRICLGIVVTLDIVAQVSVTMGWLAGTPGFFLELPLLAIEFFYAAFVLLQYARRGSPEARILLIAAAPLSIFQALVISITFIVNYIPAIPTIAALANNVWDAIALFNAGPFQIVTDRVLALLFWISMAFILIWRSNRVTKAQGNLENEIEAARQVQLVILPEPAAAIPGFRVESIYRPAQHVGGDFFQILPAADGGMLLIVGDVAGKGLPAAMLVAVLVGIIQSVSRYTHDPAEILGEMNGRLIGRTAGGFSTCLAAYFDGQGNVALANAGHLPPYLDGREVDIPGALPLGLIGDVRYELTHFELQPGQRLAFYSDGIPEAQNEKGELFGFDRSRIASTLSAEAIAQSAIDFGQSDDITVVTVEYEPAMAAAL